MFAAVERDQTPAFLYPRDDPRVGELRAALTVPSELVLTPHLTAVLVDGRVDPRLLPRGVAP